MQLISSNAIGSKVTPSLSVIVPVYNEAQVLRTFHHALCRAIANMDNEYAQILYINDGSSDNSWEIIQSLSCGFAQVHSVNLSRNFGKEAAMTAGLDHCDGDAVTFLDADLQDPPELIHTMLNKLREGYDVVNMRRRSRAGESLLKRGCAKVYYKLLGWLSDTPLEENVGDFRMLSRTVVEEIKQLPERNRYMKGLMSWPGFRQTTLSFDRPTRVAGNTKWSFWQLCKLGLAGITAFSVKPLRLATIVGVLISSVSLILGIWTLGKAIFIGDPVAGYPSLMLVQLFLGGAQFIAIGIVGEYVGQIYTEAKGRPIYLVMETKQHQVKHQGRNYG